MNMEHKIEHLPEWSSQTNTTPEIAALKSKRTQNGATNGHILNGANILVDTEVEK